MVFFRKTCKGAGQGNELVTAGRLSCNWSLPQLPSHFKILQSVRMPIQILHTCTTITFLFSNSRENLGVGRGCQPADWKRREAKRGRSFPEIWVTNSSIWVMSLARVGKPLLLTPCSYSFFSFYVHHRMRFSKWKFLPFVQRSSLLVHLCLCKLSLNLKKKNHQTYSDQQQFIHWDSWLIYYCQKVPECEWSAPTARQSP